MPSAPLMTYENASPETKKLYDYLNANWGFTPNYFLALGHDPELLQDQVNLFTHVMFQERKLPKILKEQLAIVVSGINTSSYCLPAHMEILGRVGVPKAVSRKLSLDYTTAQVEPKVMELFHFAAKLTQKPGEMQAADREKLLAIGWTNEEILEATLVASYYACANRFSAALGLMPDFE